MENSIIEKPYSDRSYIVKLGKLEIVIAGKPEPKLNIKTNYETYKKVL